MNLLKVKNLKNKYIRKFKLLLLPENRKSLVYLIGISFSFIFIILASFLTRVPNPEPKVEPVKQQEVAYVAPEVITVSTKEPSENIPKEEEYTVANDMPRAITISSANISGFIQQVGVDQDNKIAVPNNIHMVGWYINSVKPGEDGLSIIDGHVDGMYSGGVFYDLKNVSVGDEYSVTYGDGSVVNYRIVDKIEVDEADSANVLFAKRPEIKSQLNLITCTGTYLSDVESYDKRLIVVSEKL